ncbi:hypothetical protein [Nakamurella deserti]|uniref:hypothetical protein n=1 Tax=Nakamurella deserti TaxID=2164074 RepID=UPI001300455F|nr:hypothetical protein [Nakamurella deserti]
MAELLRDGSERAALAGAAVARLTDGWAPPAAGRSVRAAVEAVSTSWTDVAGDLVAGLAQLATWVDGAVTAMLTVDDTTAAEFRALPR